jgi:hypothetical protein
MERADEQPRTDGRLIQLRTAELELDFLQRKQAALVEQLRRLRQPHTPREARRRP